MFARYARDLRFESRSLLFPPTVGPCSGLEQQKDCLVASGMVSIRFRDEILSLIAQEEIVTGRWCASVVQLAECSHGGVMW